MVGTATLARPRDAKQALIGVGAGAATGALLLTLLVGTGAARAATAGFNAGVDGSTLKIQGGPAAERIALRLSANASQLLVDLGDNGSAERAFDVASFGAIAV